MYYCAVSYLWWENFKERNTFLDISSERWKKRIDLLTPRQLKCFQNKRKRLLSRKEMSQTGTNVPLPTVQNFT
jgi:hypothetical protein